MKDKHKKVCKACDQEIDKEAKECPHCGKIQADFLDKHKIFTIIIIIIIVLSVGSIFIPISQSGNSTNDTTSTTSSNSETSKATAESNSTETSKSAESTATTDKNSANEGDSKTITAHKLASAYNDDQENADKLYKDKDEAIKGRIEDTGVTLGHHYVILDPDDPFSAVKVECLFDNQSEIDKIANLTKGEEVVIEGKVVGQSENINVEVTDCVIK